MGLCTLSDTHLPTESHPWVLDTQLVWWSSWYSLQFCLRICPEVWATDNLQPSQCSVLKNTTQHVSTCPQGTLGSSKTLHSVCYCVSLVWFLLLKQNSQDWVVCGEQRFAWTQGLDAGSSKPSTCLWWGPQFMSQDKRASRCAENVRGGLVSNSPRWQWLTQVPECESPGPIRQLSGKGTWHQVWPTKVDPWNPSFCKLSSNFHTQATVYTTSQ